MSEKVFHDKRGVPVYPGDLIRSLHFRDRRRKIHYLYHVVVRNGFGILELVPACHLEPTKTAGGGRCRLSQDLIANAEVIHGHGPDGCLDFNDRPKNKP